MARLQLLKARCRRSRMRFYWTVLVKLNVAVFVAGLLSSSGCGERTTSTDPDDVGAAKIGASAERDFGDPPELQFFNERFLGRHGTKAVPVLRKAGDGAWSPKRVWLDFEESVCYAATVNYAKIASFERLREAINTRFRKWEEAAFASDPEMGAWRIEEAGFSIAMTDESDSFAVRYICWAESETVLRKLRDFSARHPDTPVPIPSDEEASAYLESIGIGSAKDSPDKTGDKAPNW